MFSSDVRLTLSKLLIAPHMEGALAAQCALVGRDYCFMSSTGQDKI